MSKFGEGPTKAPSDGKKFRLKWENAQNTASGAGEYLDRDAAKAALKAAKKSRPELKHSLEAEEPLQEDGVGGEALEMEKIRDQIERSG